MRTFLFFVGSTVGSIALQATVALYPQYLQPYAWTVKYVWMAWAAIWIVWLATHPSFWKGTHVKGDSLSTPISIVVSPNISPTFSPTVSPTQTNTQIVNVMNKEGALEPNLIFSEIVSLGVVFDMNQIPSTSFSDYDGSTCTAHLAVIANQIEGAGVGPARKISAQLILKQYETAVVETRGLGVWERQYTNVVDIFPGEQKFLVIAVEHSMDVEVYVLSNPRREGLPVRNARAILHAMENKKPINWFKVADGMHVIEITIFTDKGKVLKSFNCELNVYKGMARVVPI